MFDGTKRYRIAISAFQSPSALEAAGAELRAHGFSPGQLVKILPAARPGADYTFACADEAAESALEAIKSDVHDICRTHFDADLVRGIIVFLVVSETSSQQSMVSRVFLDHGTGRIHLCEFTRQT